VGNGGEQQEPDSNRKAGLAVETMTAARGVTARKRICQQEERRLVLGESTSTSARLARRQHVVAAAKTGIRF
jgi:hypothetical protein